jgi:hypothetical protein
MRRSSLSRTSSSPVRRLATAWQLIVAVGRPPCRRAHWGLPQALKPALPRRGCRFAHSDGRVGLKRQYGSEGFKPLACLGTIFRTLGDARADRQSTHGIAADASNNASCSVASIAERVPHSTGSRLQQPARVGVCGRPTGADNSVLHSRTATRLPSVRNDQTDSLRFTRLRTLVHRGAACASQLMSPDGGRR